jgi:hypothetical protein
MSETRRFQCLNCGHRFEAEVLSQDEKREANRGRRPTYPVACPL